MTRRPAADALGIERITYDRDEAAAAIGVDRGKFGQLISAGLIPHLQLPGCHLVIGRRALDQWLTEQCLAAVKATADEDMPPVRRLRRRSGAA